MNRFEAEVRARDMIALETVKNGGVGSDFGVS
jgi:hypothetical protein